MWRWLRLQVASLLVALACALPARAQPPAPAPANPSGTEGPSERPVALAWGVAVIFTLVILLIVCMPSRKSHP
jgi:hypothetical protein